MGYLGSDQNFWVDQAGLISTGNRGKSSRAGDPAHGYAVGDVSIPIPLSDLVVVPTDIAITRIAAGSYKKTLPASGASTVAVQLAGLMQRAFTALPGVPANPHGIKLRAIELTYRVNGANMTSLTLLVYQVNNAPADPVPTPTQLASTTAGATLTFGTPQYRAITTITTPIFITDASNQPVAEAVFTNPAGCTVDLLGGAARVSVALY